MTPERRKAVQKWNASEKGKAAARRYRERAKGKACIKRANEKRITVACRVIYLPTKATRDVAYAHIQRRRREFLARLKSRAKAESDSHGAVPAETTP